MSRFSSYDGTSISYDVVGSGPPMLCLPGGPGRSVEYLGDLGGLDRYRQLIRLDLRGVGGSATPSDPATLAVERLVADVEAARIHLGLDRLELLAHSAGAVLATLYAARFPARVSALLLITPGLAAIGVPGDPAADAVLERLAGEPWYPEAVAAFTRIRQGDLSLETFRNSRPLFYQRWDDAARAHASIGISSNHLPARTGYFADFAVDVAATRASLARLSAPVLVLVGALDPLVTPTMAHEAAAGFADATVLVHEGTGHFPWIDDATGFVERIVGFASGSGRSG